MNAINSDPDSQSHRSCDYIVFRGRPCPQCRVRRVHVLKLRQIRYRLKLYSCQLYCTTCTGSFITLRLLHAPRRFPDHVAQLKSALVRYKIRATGHFIFTSWLIFSLCRRFSCCVAVVPLQKVLSCWIPTTERGSVTEFALPS